MADGESPEEDGFPIALNSRRTTIGAIFMGKNAKPQRNGALLWAK
jgi:hypothetical protein